MTRYLIAAVLLLDALVILALAGAARADSHICWQQTDGAHPVQRVLVSGIPLHQPTISQTASSPLTYCTQPLPLATPAVVDVVVCRGDGVTCSTSSVLADGRPGPLRLYGGCRADLDDDGAVSLGDVSRALRRAVSGGACIP